MNGNDSTESKNVEIAVDQIGQYTENELFMHKISHTQYVRRAGQNWCKKAKFIFSGVVLSTVECYMIITSLFKTINLEEQ